ncbi:MAG: putative 4-hydroxybenzoate polyprenyltransferase [Acidobacteria bacterium]|nr:putative 4-hydroxybenzoate polyprenyltransferase [Acidobacteriota bacterium]
MTRRLKVIDDLRETGEMIKFQHTVFALPFALIALVSAPLDGWPPLRVWLLVLLAMVAARTAAMAFNRLADHHLDALNPRTAGRSLPGGRLSRRFVWAVTIVASLIFVLAAGLLNSLCLLLALPTLGVLLGYSLSKKFTAAAHLWLGAALGIAPIGAWIAASGRLDLPPVILGGSVMAWVAGFDIIYSLQDEIFDRSAKLHSIPVALGPDRALISARALHIVSLAGFAAFAALSGGGPLRWSAVIAATVMLGWQHTLVTPDDLSRVDAAFFTANGILAVTMGVLFIAARAVGM